MKFTQSGISQEQLKFIKQREVNDLLKKVESFKGTEKQFRKFAKQEVAMVCKGNFLHGYLLHMIKYPDNGALEDLKGNKDSLQTQMFHFLQSLDWDLDMNW